MSGTFAWQALVLAGLAGWNFELTAADLVAGFWQNYASFRTLRVQLKTTKRYGEQWFLHLKQESEQQEQAAGEEALAPDAKLDALRRADLTREWLSDPYLREPLPELQDFWTNRAKYQQRVPRPLTVSELAAGREAAARLLASWQFPDEPLKPETLVTAYREFYIISYLGEQGVRSWNFSRSGRSVGSVGPEEQLVYQSLPPLGAPRAVHDTALLHVIDQYFRIAVDQLQLVGKETIGGVVTYVLEHAQEAPRGSWLAPDPKYAERLRLIRTTRAWVAPELGFLPLRMEWSSRRELDGKPIDAGRTPPRGWKPYQVVEDVQILKVGDAGFYPVKGVVRNYMVEVNWRPPQTLSFEDLMAGRTLESIPYQLREETAWEAVKVEANIPMADEMFALPFPQGTVYVDRDEGKQYVTGSAQRVLDGAITGEAQRYQPKPPVPPPPARRGKGLTWGGLGVLAALLAWLVYVRVRAWRGERNR